MTTGGNKTKPNIKYERGGQGDVNIVAPELLMEPKSCNRSVFRLFIYIYIYFCFCGHPQGGAGGVGQFNARMQVRIGIYANEPQLSAEIGPSTSPPGDRSTSMSLHWLRFPRNQIQKSLRSATNPSDATPGTNAHNIPLESYGNQGRERSLISSLQVDVSISCGRFQVSLVQARMKIRFIFHSSPAIEEFFSFFFFWKALWENASAPELQGTRAFSITTEAVAFDLFPYISQWNSGLSKRSA